VIVGFAVTVMLPHLPMLPGECPGYNDPAISAVLIHGVDRVQEEMSAIEGPTDQEVLDALRMGSSVDYHNHNDCFRVLITQNHVILRDVICNRMRKQFRSPGVENDESGESSIGLRSLQASALVSRDGSASRPIAADSAVVISSRNTVLCSQSKKPKLAASVSPPRLFQCPACGAMFNEKDFDRHVAHWIVKSDQSAPVKDNTCAGFRDGAHPFLAHYVGSHMVRVGLLVAEIRSMLHPGAYDSLSPNGSGRHHVVARRFETLSQKPQ
jgi:hypothetical protein